MGQDKKQIKNVLHRDKQKRHKKITAQAHISLLSRIEQWKMLGGGSGRVDVRTYQNNGTENLFVVIIYLIEVFKMRLLLLLIAESSESPKKSNSTFKWLSKFSKDELMLDMLMKRDLQVFSKLRQHRKKCSLFLTSKLHYIRGSRYLESHVLICVHLSGWNEDIILSGI